MPCCPAPQPTPPPDRHRAPRGAGKPCGAPQSPYENPMPCCPAPQPTAPRRSLAAPPWSGRPQPAPCPVTYLPFTGPTDPSLRRRQPRARTRRPRGAAHRAGARRERSSDPLLRRTSPICPVSRAARPTSAPATPPGFMIAVTLPRISPKTYRDHGPNRRRASAARIRAAAMAGRLPPCQRPRQDRPPRGHTACDPP